MEFRVFDVQVAPLKEQVEAEAAEEQQQQEALVRSEMRKLNYFINKLLVNDFCVLEYSKLKMSVCDLYIFYLT